MNLSSKIVRAAALLAVAAVAAIAGCNTVEGAGKDIEKGGEKLQDAADSNR